MIKPRHLRKAALPFQWLRKGGLLPDFLYYRLKKAKVVVNRGLIKRNLRGTRVEDSSIIHFLHIRKTGGTAVREALEGPATQWNLRLEFHDHDYRLKDIPVGDKVVFFVRDPIERFVSGFLDRQRQGRPRYNSPWTPQEERAFLKFGAPGILAMSLSASDERIRRDAIHAMQDIRHINSTYWDWFDNEAYFLSRLDDILFIGFQKNLDRDFATLKGLLHVPETIRLPSDPVRSHKSPGNQDAQIPTEGRKNLTRYYAEDYRFYRICRELAAKRLTMK